MSKALDIDEDKSSKDTPFTSADHLESILYQFVNLYERWSEDRQVEAKQRADLAKFVKEFAQQTDRFSELEENVREEIATSIRTEAENTANYFSKTIGDAVHKEVEPTARKLRDIVRESEIVLARYQSGESFVSWYLIAIAVFASIFASLAIVWCLMPKPVIPITGQQLEYLKFGESMRYVWPKLSKIEQEHIKKLAADVHKMQIEQS